jgi:hypothetical protein
VPVERMIAGRFSLNEAPAAFRAAAGGSLKVLLYGPAASAQEAI